MRSFLIYAYRIAFKLLIDNYIYLFFSEQTMNHNLAQSPLQLLKQTGQSSTNTNTSSNAANNGVILLQPQLAQQHVFSLPKESYVNMFQEINRYANTINQKYLIDSGGVSMSQLRRKHHFMVMLLSLKFKFQFFYYESTQLQAVD